MKRSKLSIVSFILTILIIVGAIPVSAVSNEDSYLHDASSHSVVQDNDFSNIDDEFPIEMQVESTDALTCRITDYIDKEQFESQNYAFRIEQEESLNTYVFQTEDGKRVVYYLDENVKFVDENGEIKEKDLFLISTEKGFSPACSDIDILLPASTENSIQFNYGKSSITINPLGNTFVEGKPDGKSISYIGVFGENTILRYTPSLSGLKEDIIVTDKTAPSKYSFILKTNGLFVFSDESGFYLSTNQQSEERIRLGNVVAYDSECRETKGYLHVNEVLEGNEYVITVSVDPDFLVNESTVFPVTIDPTFTVSDNTHGANAIQDAPVFENKSSINFGDFLYDRVGTPNSDYGVGRTVVKLSGFTSSTEYSTITASQISSVIFHTREAYGGNVQTVDLHPITISSGWTESTVTWGTIGNGFDASVNYGTTMYNGDWSHFDITNLVKGWKNGTYTANCGFILKNSIESADGCFHSCECSTTGNRPYVVMTYTPTITLNYSSFDLDEGATRTITATTHPSGLPVSWYTSDSTAATVSGGIVTGVAAKTTSVTITASVTVDGTPYTDFCQVYVTISDGVYYLKNQKSGYYMTVKNGKISNLTDVIQTSKYSTVNNDVYQITQLWKIKYLSDGRYSIRPMHKLNMGLDVTSSNVDIFGIGTMDTSSGVPDYAEWTIERYTNSSSGCILKNNGLSSKTAHISAGSTGAGASVVAESYASTTDYRWTLELVSNPPVGVVLYNTSTNVYTDIPTKYIAPNENRELSSLQLTAAAYSGTGIDQTCYWLSGNTSIASVNYTTGKVTGVSPGTTTITARKYLDGAYRTASYTIIVTEIANGTYFLKSKDTSRYVDIEGPTMANGTIIHQWDFHGGDSQRWIFTHLGDGYYSIKSANSTSNYYLGVLNDGTATDTQVVLRTGTLTDGMKWRVSVTASGAFKITPKTGEGTQEKVLAIEWYFMFSVNGTKIKQRDYVDDDNYKDEWYIETISPILIDLCGIYNSGHDHSSALAACRTYLHDYGFNNIYFTEGAISGIECKNILLNTNIFTSRSHGKLVLYSGTSTACSTGIELSDVSDPDVFYSHSWSGMSTGSQSVVTTDSFTNVDLVLFIGCQTAYDGDGGRNLPTVFVSKGATVAIGFSESIDCSDANKWTKDFYSYLLLGNTVQESVDYACSRRSESSGLRSAVVCGNGNYSIN